MIQTTYSSTTTPGSSIIKPAITDIPAEQEVTDSVTQEDEYQDDYIEVHPEEHTKSLCQKTVKIIGSGTYTKKEAVN